MDKANPQDTKVYTPAQRPPLSVRRRVAWWVGLLLAATLAYLIAWPSPIDPVAYDPSPAAPLEGPLAPNDRLASAELVAVGQLKGPEDVEVDAEGDIFTGTEDGRVVRIGTDGTLTTLADTGGRPLGMAFAPDGNLIVADAVRGLLSIDSKGTIDVLETGADNRPLGFTDDVDVASDGMIYFSDASTKFGVNEFLYDMLEARPHGRLVSYDPRTRTTSVLVRDLYFANGVALSQDEDFVLVNETYRFRIMRYWLKGDRKGTSEIFIDNLPGYPDNITSNRRGTFWLSLFTVRNPEADWLAPRPWIKGVLAKLPKFLWPKPQPYAFVLKLDEQGRVVDSLQDPTGQHLRAVTSAFERDGYLYLGSLHNDRIGKYKLP